MSTVQTDRTRLSLAATISMTLLSAQLHAQEAGRTQLEEVVVTGTLIQGTPEDSALPVEVITLEELDNLGRPSAIDLVKTMTEVGQSAGEADRSNTFPIGAATVNLRNLGSRYTTVIFNGRRFPEQYSVATGRFNNISWIPQAAIGRIETLKQGGAVTYGADAIGGVVNYITRQDLDGLELNADYRYIEDSDGDYTADVLWGTKLERGNALLVVGYQHRNTLMATDRDFTRRHLLENENPWSASGSPGSYQFQTRGTTGTFTTISAAVPAGTNRYTGNRHMSLGGSMRDPYCTDLGGFAGWNATPSPACYFNESSYEKLVEESDTYQFYGELNYDLTDSLELHTELTYYQMDLPDIALSPSAGAGSWPLTTTRDASGRLVRQNVANNPAYFVPGNHPAVAPLIDALIADSGTNPTFTPAQRTAIVSGGGRVTLPFGLWRPFGAGGHPINGEYDIQRNNTQMYRATVELKGALPEFWGSKLGWSVAGTYSEVDYSLELQDMLVDRLQAALNGRGGPNCTGTTPGQNGCQWFNPFSSAIPRNVYTGRPNPGFDPSLANDPALIEWLYVPIRLDRNYRMVVADLLVSGPIGWSLPGGSVAIALGGQFRRTDETFDLDPLSDREITPCATPGVTDCANETGALVMTRATTILGTTREVDRYYPVAAVFAEMQLPFTSSITANIAGRYEKFYSDVTERDNSVFVPAGAIKWQPLDWLAARLSLGKTFSQVNPPEDDGVTEGISTTNADFGGFGDAESRYGTFNYDNVGIESEESTYYNLGFIVQLGGFQGSVDLWQNELQNGTRTLTTDHILRALTNGDVARDALINCSSPLLNPNPQLGGHPVVVLDEACVQGQTRLIDGSGSDEGNISEIHYFGGLGQTNGGGITQRGIDFNASYRLHIGPGTLTPSVDISYFLKYDIEDYELFGVRVARGYDAIGFTNTGAGRLLQAVPKWRGTLGLNYSVGRHTVNLLGRYIPTIENDDEEDFIATGATNANVGNEASVTICPAGPFTSDLGDIPEGAGSAEFGTAAGGIVGYCAGQNTALQSFRELKASYNIDLTYRVELPYAMQMSFSIYNLTNEDPEFSRSQLSYSAYFGSPLQRNYRLSFRKRF